MAMAIAIATDNGNGRPIRQGAIINYFYYDFAVAFARRGYL